MSLPRILDDLAEYLEYERDEGASDPVMDQKVLDHIRALRAAPAAAPDVPPQTQPAETRAPEPPTNRAINGAADMTRIAETIATCKKCSLHETRTNTVPGQGSSSPDILFIGEAPGYDEDQQGLAFVGRAGKLLTKMIEAMGYQREDVFIGNILKCRPPNNRKPLPDETETCLPYLREQITQLKPKVIIALGATAVHGLLGLTTGITKLRGKWLSFEGIDLMPTFHPAYLLRSPSAKKDVWEDLKTVLRHLGKPIPKVKK